MILFWSEPKSVWCATLAASCASVHTTGDYVTHSHVFTLFPLCIMVNCGVAKPKRRSHWEESGHNDIKRYVDNKYLNSHRILLVKLNPQLALNWINSASIFWIFRANLTIQCVCLFGTRMKCNGINHQCAQWALSCVLHQNNYVKTDILIFSLNNHIDVCLLTHTRLLLMNIY